MRKVSQACGLQLGQAEHSFLPKGGLCPALDQWKNASVGPRIAAFFFRDQAEHISCQKGGLCPALDQKQTTTAQT